MREWFKSARKKAGYTKESLAREVRVTLGTIANWEAGKHEPHELTHEGLSRALQVDVKQMLSQEKQAKP